MRLRAGQATLGEVFTFLSGLYFRGKIAYARAFARPPGTLPGTFVITPNEGIRLTDEAMDLDRLRSFARGAINLAGASGDHQATAQIAPRQGETAPLFGTPL